MSPPANNETDTTNSIILFNDFLKPEHAFRELFIHASHIFSVLSVYVSLKKHKNRKLNVWKKQAGNEVVTDQSCVFSMPKIFPGSPDSLRQDVYPGQMLTAHGCFFCYPSCSNTDSGTVLDKSSSIRSGNICPSHDSIYCRNAGGSRKGSLFSSIRRFIMGFDIHTVLLQIPIVDRKQNQR